MAALIDRLLAGESDEDKIEEPGNFGKWPVSGLLGPIAVRRRAEACPTRRTRRTRRDLQTFRLCFLSRPSSRAALRLVGPQRREHLRRHGLGHQLHRHGEWHPPHRPRPPDLRPRRGAPAGPRGVVAGEPCDSLRCTTPERCGFRDTDADPRRCGSPPRSPTPPSTSRSTRRSACSAR